MEEDDFLMLSLSLPYSEDSVDFTLSLFPECSENLGASKPISTSVNFSSIDNPNSPFLTLFPQLPENLATPPSSLVPPPSTHLSTSSTITTLQCSNGSSVFASSRREVNGSGNCAPKRLLLQQLGEEKFVPFKKIKLTKESTNSSKQKGIIIREEAAGDWIRKKLTRSDVNGASRLLLPRQDVNNYILPFMDEEKQSSIRQQLCGIDVTVFDMDTETEHILTLRKWSTDSFLTLRKWSTDSFHLVKAWTTDFVKRRNLKENDVISIRWEKNNSRFCFRLQMRNQVDGL